MLPQAENIHRVCYLPLYKHATHIVCIFVAIGRGGSTSPLAATCASAERVERCWRLEDERGQPLRQRLIRLRRWHPGGLALSLPANLHAARRGVGQGKAMICDVRTAKIIISGALKLYGLQCARPKFAPSFASERISREIEKERPARKEIYLLQ